MSKELISTLRCKAEALQLGTCTEFDTTMFALNDAADRISELEQKLRNAEYAKKMVIDHRDELERQLQEANEREASDYSKLLDEFNGVKVQNVSLTTKCVDLERQVAELRKDADRYQQLLCMSSEEAVELFQMNDIDAMEIQLDAALAQAKKEGLCESSR